MRNRFPPLMLAARMYFPSTQDIIDAKGTGAEAIHAAGDVRLLVPDLFWPEIGNILWKASRMGRISGKSATRAVESLMAQRIPTSPSLPLLSDAFMLAGAFGRTVYDSIYIALAIASNRMFVTADERLANAVAAHFPVRWLGAL